VKLNIGSQYTNFAENSNKKQDGRCFGTSGCPAVLWLYCHHYYIRR